MGWKVVPAIVGIVKGAGAGVGVEYPSREAADKVAAQVKGAKVVETGKGGGKR